MATNPNIRDDCEFYAHYLDGVCTVTWIKCNPHHPDCEYADERELGIPEELLKELDEHA